MCRQKGQDLMKAATAARDRVRRKLALQEKEYAAARDREYLCGCPVSSSPPTSTAWSGAVDLPDGGELLRGGLSRQLDIPSGSAADASAERRPLLQAVCQGQDGRERILTEQLDKGSAGALAIWRAWCRNCSRRSCEQDFNDIRTELTEGGYLRGRGKKQPGFQRASRPREFRSTAGLRILVGRSNRQNDRLTCKDADRRDIWFHTQKIHGSHVILCTGGTEPDHRSIEEAASLAAYYSQGREGAQGAGGLYPGEIREKARRGSSPGMVVYTTYQTIYAVPDEALARRLSVK